MARVHFSALVVTDRVGQLSIIMNRPTNVTMVSHLHTLCTHKKVEIGPGVDVQGTYTVC